VGFFLSTRRKKHELGRILEKHRAARQEAERLSNRTEPIRRLGNYEMTTEDVAKLFERPHREGKKYRARCPVHKSRGSTLAIYPDKDKTGIHCFAGCKTDDILAAVGLTFKDLYYQSRIQTPATRRRSMLFKRLEAWEKILALADSLRASPAKIEKAENEIIWMRRELYPDQLLPERLRGECTKWNTHRYPM